MRLLTVRSPAYTLPGGDPRMSDTMASRAILMFWKEPIMWIFLRRVELGGMWGYNEIVVEHLRICKHDARSAGVFDREFGFAILACYATCLSQRGQRGAEERGVGWINAPIARDRWSPCKVFTSLISNVSRYRSSRRRSAMASCRSYMSKD